MLSPASFRPCGFLPAESAMTEEENSLAETCARSQSSQMVQWSRGKMQRLEC